MQTASIRKPRLQRQKFVVSEFWKSLLFCWFPEPVPTSLTDAKVFVHGVSWPRWPKVPPGVPRPVSQYAWPQRAGVDVSIANCMENCKKCI